MPSDSQASIYLTPGLDQCLEMHTLVTIEKRAKELEGSDAKMANRKSFSRLFFAQTQPCELDSQNRVLIPNRLMGWADLSNRIVILGVGTHWEIWNDENWQTYYQHHKAAFDELASAMCDGELPQVNSDSTQRKSIRVNPK